MKQDDWPRLGRLSTELAKSAGAALAAEESEEPLGVEVEVVETLEESTFSGLRNILVGALLVVPLTLLAPLEPC